MSTTYARASPPSRFRGWNGKSWPKRNRSSRCVMVKRRLPSSSSGSTWRTLATSCSCRSWSDGKAITFTFVAAATTKKASGTATTRHGKGARKQHDQGGHRRVKQRQLPQAESQEVAQWHGVVGVVHQEALEQHPIPTHVGER